MPFFGAVSSADNDLLQINFWQIMTPAWNANKQIVWIQFGAIPVKNHFCSLRLSKLMVTASRKRCQIETVRSEEEEEEKEDDR